MLKNKKDTLFLLLIFLFSLLIRLPYLNMPLERDEGEYAYTAWRIAQGDLPYRDIVSQKPPLIFYLYLFAQKTLGYKVSDIHLFMSLYTLISIFFLYKLGQLLFSSKVGLLGGLLFSIMVTEPAVLGSAANCEIFMLLPVILSIYLLLKGLKQSKINLLFWSGFFNGIAFMIKQVAIFNFLFVVLVIGYYFLWRKRDFCKLKIAWGICLLGWCSGVLPFIIYFYARGAGADFYYWVFQHNFSYVSKPSLSWGALDYLLKRLQNISRFDWVWWVFALSTLLKVFKRNKTVLFIWGWLMFSVMGLVVGWRFTHHYFQQIMPALAILSAIGFWTFYNRLSSKITRVILAVFVGLIFLGANYPYFFQLTPEEISLRLYTDNPFVEATVVAEYIKQNTCPDDFILVLGSEPEIYYYAQRCSATKYIIFYPLADYYQDSLQKQEQVYQEILKNKPTYIVVINIVFSQGISNYAEQYLFKKVYDILQKDYFLDGFVILGTKEFAYILGKEQAECFSRYLNRAAPIMIYRSKI